MTPEALTYAVAAHLSSGMPGTNENAWLEYEGQVFFARYLRAPNEPQSAVTRLIQGIWDEVPLFAQKILRSRIYTSANLTPMCRGMIDIAAKRVTEGVALSAVASTGLVGSPTLTFREVTPKPSTQYTESPSTLEMPYPLLFAEARKLADESRSNLALPFHSLPRGVAACLIDPLRRTVAWSVNRNDSNRTHHAEVLLVQGHWQRHHRSIPSGAKILTTLQPCRMCAGMISEAAENLNELEVLYLEPDAGPAASFTALDAIARQWQGS